MKLKNVLLYGEGWFNITPKRLIQLLLINVLSYVVLFSMFTVPAAAVPTYAAVELCNVSMPAGNVRDVTITPDDDLWVNYRQSDHFYKFPGCAAYTEDFAYNPTGTNSGGCAMLGWAGVLYFTSDGNDYVERINDDGTGLAVVQSLVWGDSFEGMCFYENSLYAVWGNDKIYREPYVSGQAKILVFDTGLGSNCDLNGIFYREDGSFLVSNFGSAPSERILYYNSSNGLEMKWTLPFTFTDSAGGIVLDSYENLWVVTSANDVLYKVNLPNLPDQDSGGDQYSVSVAGKTRDITGNIVSGVLVEVGAYNDTSNNLGDYTVSGALISDSMTIDASKVGYENYDVTLHGITENGSYVHDVYMIPEGELLNADIGGIVYDYCNGVVISNALVNLYDSDNSILNYTYTSEYGYYKFSDLGNETNYTLFASKSNYENSEKYSFLAYNTTYYVKNVWLLPLGGCDVGLPVEPTPTPTPGPDDKPIIDGIRMIFDLFGLGSYMGYIFAFVCIAVMGTLFGGVCGSNTLGFLIGGFFGYIIDVAIGWLPIWTVAVVICVVLFFLVKQVAKE